MRVYISKFILILGAFCAIVPTCATVFFIWIVYQLSGPSHQTTSRTLLVLCSISVFLICVTLVVWWFAIKGFRWRNKIIISFDENSVSYWTKNYKELVTTQYDEIRKIDIDTVILPKGSRLYLQLHKNNGDVDDVFLNNLGKSITDIFRMFKEKCPHLTQPYSTVLLLT